MAVVVQVHRGHRHDGDHDELGEDHRQRTRYQPGTSHGRDGLPGAVARRAPQVEAAGQQQGVRAQPDGEDEGRQSVGGAGQQERTGQGADAQGLGEVAGGRGEVGTDHAAEGGGDQDGGDGTGAVGRCREVGPGVAGLEVGGGSGAVDEQGDEEQYGAVGDGSRDDAGAADGTGQVSDGQTRSAAPGLGEAAHQDGGQGRSGGEQGDGQPREVGGAEHVLREQGADGDARREPGPAQDLAADEDGEDPALHLGPWGRPSAVPGAVLVTGGHLPRATGRLIATGRPVEEGAEAGRSILLRVGRVPSRRPRPPPVS